ncbi:MAG: glycerol-3-phosphate acyltransferase, partial [Clostridia bacterium]|nr:glycerol-3-phosphate acyltransferase [Clostridia bacterium]
IVTTAAIGAMMNPFMALIVIAIGVGTIIISKYVSLGSVTAMISYPILVAVTGGDAPYIIFSTVLMLLAVIKHRANIKRLIKHEESKITSKKA